MLHLTPTQKRYALGGLAALFVLATALGTLLATHKSQAASLNIPQRVVATGARSDAVGSSLKPYGTTNLKSLKHTPGIGRTMPYLSSVSAAALAAKKAAALHDANLRPEGGANLPTQPSTQTPNPIKAFNGQVETGSTPSDMGLGVGSGDIVQVVNSSIAVYSTAGTQLVAPTALTAFFGVGSSFFLRDPRVVFDANHSRFIILIDDLEGSPFTLNTQASNYRIAVSTTSDPTGAYSLYSFSVGENIGTANAIWADFPELGIDNEAIYFSGNRYSYSISPAFVNSFVTSVNITQLEAGVAATTFEFNNLSTGDGSAFAVAPAITYGTPRAEVMISTDINAAGFYVIWAFSNPLGTAPRLTYAKLGGTYFSTPPMANQPGTNGTHSIDTGDNRVSGQPVFFDGSIYYAINTAYNNGSGTNVSAVRWLANGVAFNFGDASCGAIPNRCVDLTNIWWRGYATIGYTGTADAYDPSVAVDTDGNLYMDYTISSTTYRPYGVIYGHRITTQLLQVGTAAVAISGASSSGFYGQSRWGDYSAIALDPSSCTGSTVVVHCYTVFFSGMAANASGQWFTYISSDNYTINDY